MLATLDGIVSVGLLKKVTYKLSNEELEVQHGKERTIRAEHKPRCLFLGLIIGRMMIWPGKCIGNLQDVNPCPMLAFTLFPQKDSNLKDRSEGNSTKIS